MLVRAHGSRRTPTGARAARRAERLPLAGRHGALPRRRRPAHGLLLGDGRLRRDGQAAPALHARPRALPRRDPRVHHRVRGGGAVAAAAHLRGGGRGPRRRARGHGAVPRALRRLGAALLPVGRRRRGGAGRGRRVRARKAGSERALLNFVTRGDSSATCAGARASPLRACPLSRAPPR
jgi:hypothetical protein